MSWLSAIEKEGGGGILKRICLVLAVMVMVAAMWSTPVFAKGTHKTFAVCFDGKTKTFHKAKAEKKFLAKHPTATSGPC